MTEPENVPRNWRVIQLVKENLTEAEARAALKQWDKCYAEDSNHNYIEYHNGPVTVGRLVPQVP